MTLGFMLSELYIKTLEMDVADICNVNLGLFSMQQE